MQNDSGIINPCRIRSWLFVPGINTKFHDKLLGMEGDGKPDAIIFDLEDSVHVKFKEEARKAVARLLCEEHRKGLFDKYVVSVRVNSYGTEWFEDDIAMARDVRPHFIILPKTESPEEVRTAKELSGVRQAMVLVETIRGFEMRDEIMKGMEWHDVLALGYEDLSAELMMERPRDLNSANPLTHMILQCVMSARKNDVLMIDSVFRRYMDEEGLRGECYHMAGMGLMGKLAIHPSQVPIINSFFNHGDRVENARSIIETFERMHDGSFVVRNSRDEALDMPSYKFYKNVLKRWERR